MFESKFAYDINSPIKVSKASTEGENKSELYKVRTTDRRPYFIKMNYYDNGVHFVKFYPAKLNLSPNKYKIRVGNIKEFTRLISTCIKLSVRLLEENKDAIIGFVGDWDGKDVERESEVSQRYRIYEKAVLSVVSKTDKFNVDFIVIKKINAFIVYPNKLNSDFVTNMMMEQFSKILGDNILNLFIPKRAEEE